MGRRILIAASGTGGHIIPALSVANKLRSLDPSIVIEFIGAGKHFESEILHEFKRHIVPMVGVNRRGAKGLLEALSLMPGSFVKTWKLFSVFRPDCVIGMGGYVSFLPVVVGFIKGIPSLIHEAELHLGTANRLLVYLATKITLAFKETRVPISSKAVFTGHPIREEIIALSFREWIAPEVPKHLLILGGSQGANSIDNAVIALMDVVKQNQFEIWHQCRLENQDLLRSRYEQNGIRARVSPFLKNIVEAYEWADLIIARSGASTVMEIGVINKPAIFVPFPNSQAAHQKENALVLVRQGKAVMVEEGESFTARLSNAVKEMVNPYMYKNVCNLGYDQRSIESAEKIAQIVLDISGN